MPNELGLYSKQEAKIINDLFALNDYEKLREIADMIYNVQHLTVPQTSITFNLIVHKDVSEYFKNTVGYDVVSDDTGQLQNYTKLISISWDL